MSDGFPSPCADQVRALHALVDGELDALASAGLEEHLRTCPGCRAELERLEGLRALLGAPDLRDQAPPALKARIIAATTGAAPEHTGGRTPLAAWIGGGAIGALAASLALVLLVPSVAEPGMTEALVDGQIRSLQASHLTDVAVSDRHVIKPWFNGRLDFAPPVVDLTQQGFALAGGRLDVIGQRDVAVIVYRRRLHAINLYLRPAPAFASPFATSLRHSGYNLMRWTGGGLEFWAVSDVDAADLAAFRQAFIAGLEAHTRER